METLHIEIPMMYGDHHVIEVRRILLEISGVVDVYASSSFQSVEITFDPEKVKREVIESRLEESGYLGEWIVPVEADAATYLEADRSESYFRHTQVFETNREVMGFAQNVSYLGRPLWNCPGMGIIKNEMEEE